MNTPPPPVFEACIFDLDGVLIDSEPIHLEALGEVFHHHGLAVPAAGMAAYIGQTDEAVLADAARGRSDLSIPALLAAKRLAYERRAERLQMVPGALVFIQEATQAGLRVGLATSSTRASQQLAFARFSLAPYFGAVVTAEDVTRTKPDPEPYRRAAEMLGVAPAACLVVEDSHHGVRAGKSAGCWVAGLTTSFPAARLAAAGADCVVDRFHDLHPFINPSPR